MTKHRGRKVESDFFERLTLSRVYSNCKSRTYWKLTSSYFEGQSEVSISGRTDNSWDEYSVSLSTSHEDFSLNDVVVHFANNESRAFFQEENMRGHPRRCLVIHKFHGVVHCLVWVIAIDSIHTYTLCLEMKFWL